MKDLRIQEQLNTKLLNMILYFIERDNCTTSKIGLMKYLFYADFTYYRDFQKSISNAPYVKLPFGPCVDRWEQYIDYLIKNGYIERVRKIFINNSHGDYYKIKKGAFSDTDFSSEEISRMNEVYQELQNYSSSALSEMAHKEVPYLESPYEGAPVEYDNAYHISLLDKGDDENEEIPEVVVRAFEELEV